MLLLALLHPISYMAMIYAVLLKSPHLLLVFVFPGKELFLH